MKTGQKYKIKFKIFNNALNGYYIKGKIYVFWIPIWIKVRESCFGFNYVMYFDTKKQAIKHINEIIRYRLDKNKQDELIELI